MTKSFPTGSLRIDPKAAADEMIRIFGDEAEVSAQRRIAHFLQQGDGVRVTQWFMVAAHIREMTALGAPARRSTDASECT